MANVVVCYYSENGESFYDAFCGKLKDIGNNVFQFNTKNYIKSTTWGDEFSLLPVGFKVISRIKKFKPDLIFSFNNAFPTEVIDDFSCPICLWDADDPQFFWNKEYLKQNLNRFTFLGFKECSRDFYERTFKGKIKNYYYCPAGTFCKKENMKIKHNISFIGGHFLHMDYIRTQINIQQCVPLAKFYYQILKKNWFADFQNVEKLTKDDNLLTYSEVLRKRVFYFVRWHIIPGQERNKTLSVLSDLGLTIYGTKEWISTVLYDMDLCCCFDPTPVISLKDNEDVYNTSKLSVNLSHPQAQECFSWRVMDIMASNACLLTEKKQDFLNLFGPYLSDEVKEAIIYKDIYDLRQKAIRLLNDEKLRQKCVHECQQAIEQNGRWEKRFNDLENYLKISLFEKQNGKLTVIRNIENVYYQPKLFRKIKHKRIHFWQYMFYCLISELPLIDKLFGSQKRNRFYEKLEKYRRKK